MTFDTIVVVDWSAADDRGPTPKKDAIWAAVQRNGAAAPPVYLRSRTAAEDWLAGLCEAELAAGRRLLLGFDFPFGYPAGFAESVVKATDPLALWDWFAAALPLEAKAAERFHLAARLNALFPGVGPFWFNGLQDDIPHLPRTDIREGHGMAERRLCEESAAGAFPLWQMGGAGAVGGQAMTGMAALARLRARFQGQVAVWPFEPLDAPIALVEVWPSLFASDIAAAQGPDEIKDAAQVRVLAAHIATAQRDGHLDCALSDVPVEAKTEEGWILGLGQPDFGLSSLTPPRLKDDCFAMPQGVDWVPVDAALKRLRGALHPITGTERIATANAAGRVLAAAAVAQRANPPAANSAVDGYGFAHGSTGAGPQRMPLVQGRAAAGQPFMGTVPSGAAIRILTGAILPKGVDAVVLEEDTATDGIEVAFDGPIRAGANTRRAGEDVAKGDPAIACGHVLRPPDLALLTALGVAEVEVHRRLRVGVLSTGDELVSGGASPTGPHQIYDANRPMLLSLAERWGYRPVDLGHAPDDPVEIAARLDKGAHEADVVLTSGGASAGDEDHVSRVLREQGSLSSWRIALKPGRPLALALWRGIPVLGLPGNPVAALVCALVFGRPAMSMLAGSGWAEVQGFTVPAAFSKSKKPGRREYLRARIDAEGRADVFRSEGSGRISGLSWATGLVELPDAAAEIAPGTPVRFLPYASFGL
ncbi:molybdopterin molybdotransferase [Rhodovulum iodosum]|uniref:Molybdopterin molybdenumtransferase n=1 Tax=Rhodovulum iodosum TaxID=68291 RepID=A0ABV3XPC8_9RHOB|nr:gephyrin-like molybdotransferase Glp [Rhodovulum robiginosum]RSK31524.1 molybdopterin molybdenumtransferase MoeA [Rhodovulum robiginosum]